MRRISYMNTKERKKYRKEKIVVLTIKRHMRNATWQYVTDIDMSAKANYIEIAATFAVEFAKCENSFMKRNHLASFVNNQKLMKYI